MRLRQRLIVTFLLALGSLTLIQCMNVPTATPATPATPTVDPLIFLQTPLAIETTIASGDTSPEATAQQQAAITPALNIPQATPSADSTSLPTHEAEATTQATMITTTTPVASEVTTTPPEDAEVYGIAVHVPLSGEYGAIGQDILKAVELKKIETQSSLNGQGIKLEVLPYDDQGQDNAAVVNTKKIVDHSSIRCVIGHYQSRVALAALPAYTNNSIVLISPTNTNIHITDDNANTWRLVGRDDIQGKAAADFAKNTLGSQRVYVIHDGDPNYGKGVADAFVKQAHSIGLIVDGPVILNSNTLASTLASLAQADPKPDLIFYGGYAPQAGPLFAAITKANLNPIHGYLGADGLDSKDLLITGGDAVRNMHFTAVAAPVDWWPRAGHFKQAFFDTYHEPAGVYTAESYDAAQLCINAIIAAKKSATQGSKPSRSDVLAAMANITHEPEQFMGASGTYEFNGNGDPRSAWYGLIKVTASDPEAWNTNITEATATIGP